MHIIFRNFLTQYSRRLLSILAQTQTKTKIKKKQVVFRDDIALIHHLQTSSILCAELNKERSEKNAEHTRMHTIFRNFLSQYSRRLLSILAQIHQNTND